MSALVSRARGLVRRSPAARRAAKAVHRRWWQLRLRVRSGRGERTTIVVDPQRITRALAQSSLTELVAEGPLRDRIGTVRAGDWDRTVPIDEQELLLAATTAHLVDGVPWEATPFHAAVVADVAAGKRRFGASTPDEVDAEFATLDELARVVRRDGYRSQRELGTGRDWDEVMVAIDRDGRLAFVNGAHRLAVARALDLPAIPASVTLRHADWLAFTADVRSHLRRRGADAYQPINHPDLADVASDHGTERLDMVLPCLPGPPASVLDIGCNWGWFVIELAQRGYQCTGVEAVALNARYARRFAAAADVAGSVEIISDSVFSLTSPNADVVLALSIFHHFLKRPDTQDQLASFLGRLKTDTLVFQPHLPSDGGMQAATWNPTPDVFAEWVAEHAGLVVRSELGPAADGRPLFLLTRSGSDADR